MIRTAINHLREYLAPILADLRASVSELGDARNGEVETLTGAIQSIGRIVGVPMPVVDDVHVAALIAAVRERSQPRDLGEPSLEYLEQLYRDLAREHERGKVAAPTDPWALPAGLTWGRFGEQWAIEDRAAGQLLWLAVDGYPRGKLTWRADAAQLIALLRRRRNVVEPGGPKGGV